MNGAVYILYHCNDMERCNRFIKEPDFLIESKEDGIWLGSGMYFWDNISNAHYWEEKKAKEVSNVAIVVAKVNGDRMLDLTDTAVCDRLETMYRRLYRSITHRDSKYETLGRKLNFLYEKVPFFKENYDLVRVYGQYPKTPPSSLFRYENIQTKPTLAVKCI